MNLPSIKSGLIITLSGFATLLLTGVYVLAQIFTVNPSDSIPLSDSVALSNNVVVNQVLNDSIHFTDSLSLNSLLAIITVTLHDTIGIMDGVFAQLGQFTVTVTTIVGCAVSCGTSNNPFINSSGTSFDLQLTEIAFPAAFLFVSIFLFDKYGVKNQLIIPIALFIILGMSWVGLLPSWVILIVIIITAILIASLISRIFNGGSGGGDE